MSEVQKLKINGVQVFSATMARDRETLGQKVTEWLRDKQRSSAFTVVDYLVQQSSDANFHCVSIIVFYNEQLEPPVEEKPTKTRTRRVAFSP